MALKYYDHDESAMYRNLWGYKINVRERIDYPNEVTASSKIYKAIQYYNYYRPFLYHQALIDTAKSLRDYSTGVKLYNTIIYDKSSTNDEAVKKERFDKIVNPHLAQNLVTLIHLERDNAYGHWIVLVGAKWAMDENGGVITDIQGYPVITDVYILDPSRYAHAMNEGAAGWACEAEDNGASPYTCLVQKIDYNIFLNSKWYKSSNQEGAYWDGVYVGFGYVEKGQN
jgi:hypothetical protein